MPRAVLVVVLDLAAAAALIYAGWLAHAAVGAAMLGLAFGIAAWRLQTE